MTATTVNIASKTALSSNVIMGLGAYCCKSWTYSVLRANTDGQENARSRNYGPFKTKNKKHGVKLTKNIQIKHISATPLFLLVNWSAPGYPQNKPLQVNRARFEQWLYYTSRLDWCLTEIEHLPLDKAKSNSQNNWAYDIYGITLQDLATYIHDNKLLI